jgi:hypothetical protein
MTDELDEHPGTKHRRHRSRAEADRIAAEYEASDLSREQFCEQKGLPVKTLSRYVTRYRKHKAASNQPQRWVEAEVAGQGGCGGELAVLLRGGRRIEVKRGFDAGTLRQLVAVLEQA